MHSSIIAKLLKHLRQNVAVRAILIEGYSRFVHFCTHTFKLLPEQMLIIKRGSGGGIEHLGPRRTKSVIFLDASSAGEIEDDEDEEEANEIEEAAAAVRVDELDVVQ